MKSFLREIQEFQIYCNDFYNEKTGIYPIASEAKINAAVRAFITSPKGQPIYFDSIDREQVRAILEKENHVSIENKLKIVL